MMHEAQRRKAVRIAGGIVIAVVLLLQFLPIALVVLFSFHSSPRLAFPMEGFSTRWYASAFAQAGFREALINSLIGAAATAVIASVGGFMAALTLQSLAPERQRIADAALGLPNITPPLLIGIGIALLSQALGIRKGLVVIVAGHVIVALPFVYLAIRAKVASFDFSLIEAARDLGANPARAFLDITWPLMRPAFLSAALMAAALSMDEFIVTSFVRGVDDTVPTLTFGLLRRGVDPTINAMATMVLAGTFLFALSALLLSRNEP